MKPGQACGWCVRGGAGALRREERGPKGGAWWAEAWELE